MWMPILLRLVEMLIGVLGAYIIAAIKKLSSKDVSERIAGLAIQHVTNLMQAGIDDDAKRKLAFEGIKADCVRLGIEAKDWLVNMAIEAAVGKLKSDKA